MIIGDWEEHNKIGWKRGIIIAEREKGVTHQSEHNRRTPLVEGGKRNWR